MFTLFWHFFGLGSHKYLYHTIFFCFPFFLFLSLLCTRHFLLIHCFLSPHNTAGIAFNHFLYMHECIDLWVYATCNNNNSSSRYVTHWSDRRFVTFSRMQLLLVDNDQLLDTSRCMVLHILQLCYTEITTTTLQLFSTPFCRTLSRHRRPNEECFATRSKQLNKQDT